MLRVGPPQTAHRYASASDRDPEQPTKGTTMDAFNLNNPLFATYAIAATLMILKVVSMSWLTVVRMLQEKAWRSPEDLRKTLINPEPDPKQLEPNERVERIRRIQMNDLENVPFFLVAAFLYVLTKPSLLLAQVLLYGYVASRLLHFAAYLTAQIHDLRATFWTVGSLILIFMTFRVLFAALGY
jgi:glutathione S-transferase